MITKLTPEETAVLNSVNKQIIKYLVIPVLGLVFIILVAFSFKNTQKEDLIQSNANNTEVNR